MKTDQAVKISQTFNGRVQFDIAGGYFKLLSAPAAVDVELWNGGRKVLDALGCDAGFYQRADFDKIVLVNSVNQAVSVLVAGDEGGSDQFTGSFNVSGPLDADNADAGAELGASGLVAVAARLKGYNGATFDRLRADDEGAGAGALRVALFGDAMVMAGAAFAGYVQQDPPGAGLIPQVQLYNPAASGKVLYVDQVTLTSDSNQPIFLKRHNAALATLAAVQPVNKLFGGAASVAAIRRAAPAAAVGTQFAIVRVLASVTFTVRFAVPLRIPEGYGLVAEIGQIANCALDASFEWREKAA